MSEKKTINEIAKLAVEIQDAVNLGALVRSWAEWQEEINADAKRRNIDRNQHPVNVIMADKLADLTHRGEDFSKAYNICADLAAQKNKTEG
jgi:hypothetical protein